MSVTETPPRARSKAKTVPPDGGKLTDDEVRKIAAGAAKKTARTPDERKLMEAVAQAYGAIGVATIGLGMRAQDDGLVASGEKTVEMAPALADAWIDLSRRNAKVKEYIVKLTQASAAGVVFGMHVAILLPFLASRGIVPGMPTVPDTGEPEG